MRRPERCASVTRTDSTRFRDSFDVDALSELAHGSIVNVMSPKAIDSSRTLSESALLHFSPTFPVIECVAIYPRVGFRHGLSRPYLMIDIYYVLPSYLEESSFMIHSSLVASLVTTPGES